ncbi:transcription elongation factor GreB [sulfur-oxidizing endosymbiont of Gigantopelta aegis]|uniref:transcription elongation factor GreB n=1 Tax=sulfur-oxidizing endosymbiont of Gigantopelta aegis TaxID=2794934 RepID=UPI0018DE58B5|nr:transcription elongation factor GreB [sulfur-oxidizing endosymbiont of Gigantopelta aegis]
MGRYRAPRPPSSKYITPEGKARMEEELSYLWKVKRPAITQTVSEAAAQGDRSENAEYIYGKKQLREIDSRVRFLSKRLDDMVAVDRIPEDKKKVFFGAWVELEDESGTLQQFRIVGPDEFDVKRGFISMDSPLAQAILNKREGDDVVFQGPKGMLEYYLNRVQYEAFS